MAAGLELRDEHKGGLWRDEGWFEPFEYWVHPETFGELTISATEGGRITWHGDIASAATIATLLGILPYQVPQGYRLIKEETVRGAIQVCEWHINATHLQKDVEVAPSVLDMKEALEAALSGKEVPKT